MKLIPLTQNKFTTVDDEDYGWLSQWKWYADRHLNTYYARRGQRKDSKTYIIRMHRLILNAQKGQQIDHINRNGLDNRRSNLRFCTSSQNIQNQTTMRSGTSRYKGVCWDKYFNKWEARVQLQPKRYLIGRFKNEIEAAKAYDTKAKELFGEFARLNFPETTRSCF